MTEDCSGDRIAELIAYHEAVEAAQAVYEESISAVSKKVSTKDIYDEIHEIGQDAAMDIGYEALCTPGHVVIYGHAMREAQQQAYTKAVENKLSELGISRESFIEWQNKGET